MINSRKIRWVRHVVCIGESRGVYRVLVEKPEGKRSLGIPRLTWEDNIEMDPQEMGCEVMELIDVAQVRDRRRHF